MTMQARALRSPRFKEHTECFSFAALIAWGAKNGLAPCVASCRRLRSSIRLRHAGRANRLAFGGAATINRTVPHWQPPAAARGGYWRTQRHHSRESRSRGSNAAHDLGEQLCRAELPRSWKQLA